MPAQTHFGQILAGKDIFLCHTGVNKEWVEQLAERIESVPYKDRHLGVVFDKWDFAKGKNVVLEIDERIDKCRFIGRGGAHVGPILSQWLNQERNGQLLRSLRFWSLVLTRGDRTELRIRTGHEAIAIGLTPANGTLGFGIGGDTIDYDRLMNAEFQDDLSIPDLLPVAPEQYSLEFEVPAGTQ